MKILVVDDHAVVRVGVKRVLAELAGRSEIDEARDGFEALDKARRTAYDVIVLDIAIPGQDGIDVLKQLKSERPGVKVLVLTMYPEDQLAVRTLKAGAMGYLTKERAAEELLAAVQRVAAGGKYITSSLAELLAEDLERGSEGSRHALLSDRELQVLLAIAAGKAVSEVAAALHLSVKTISTYRARILKKTGLTNNTALVRYVLEHKLDQLVDPAHGSTSAAPGRPAPTGPPSVEGPPRAR